MSRSRNISYGYSPRTWKETKDVRKMCTRRHRQAVRLAIIHGEEPPRKVKTSGWLSW